MRSFLRLFGKHFTDKAELTAYALDIIKQKLQENQKVVVLAKGSSLNENGRDDLFIKG